MADVLAEALRIVREGAKLDTAPSMKALAAEIERLYAIEEVVLAVPALLAEIERLRAIEAAAIALEDASRYSRVYPESLLLALRTALEKGGAK